jgi:hypothetical protein
VRFGRNKIVPAESSIFRLNLDNTPAELAVMHGSVHVDDDENLSIDLHTNESARFDPQNPDEYQLLQSVAADSWDQWNSDRDEALASLDDNATDARASTGNPDDPGWSDLDASGDWYDVPGYGTGWAPSGVGQDWDPYGVGSWGYYNGIGYTWISGYSWGWWPYHCGAWSWFDGFGWMWFPGNCGWGSTGFGWYPYGVIWRTPPGYRYPRRPRGHPIPLSGDRSRVHEPLIAVNRGPQFTQQQFRSVGGVKTARRVFQYDGRDIAPIETTLHPHQGGPLGEGFTSTVLRSNPQIMFGGASGGNRDRPSSGIVFSPYQPGHTGGYAPRYVPPPSGPAPAGHVSAPAPVFHAPPPASAPAAGGHSHR